MRKDRWDWQTWHSMCSVFSYNGKDNFDICILEELRQKSLVTYLGFSLENRFENVSMCPLELLWKEGLGKYPK